MKNNSDDVARQILTNYLLQNNCRKTPERFAILETVYKFKSYFSIQDLSDKLASKHFPISRATLYNTLKLFIKLKIVVYHHLDEGIRYEACHTNNRCIRICTICGKEQALDVPEIVKAIEGTHFKRFHYEGFTLFVYGVCSTCLAIQTRQKKKQNAKNKVETTYKKK
ncbi:MAG: transcriptional repressor [Prevotella sp.]|nr:transcriptional repressor [Prevotella sp.]